MRITECHLSGNSSSLSLLYVFFVSVPDRQFPVRFPISVLHIRKTCPCNIYPLIPHFYIAKLGYAGIYMYICFLFLLQNRDCGYSLEPPRRFYRVPTIYVLSKIRKISRFFFQFLQHYENLPMQYAEFFFQQ